MTQEGNDIEIEARYTRSSAARTIHVDGAYGGLTGSANIHMAIYNEHRSVSEFVVVRLNTDGTVSETPNDPKAGRQVIREVEADLILDAVVARAIRDWLSARLEELERAKGAEQQQTGGAQ